MSKFLSERAACPQYKRRLISLLPMPPDGKASICIAQFNMLADGLSGSLVPSFGDFAFTRRQPGCLDWRRRRLHLLHELIQPREYSIAGADAERGGKVLPDIVCVQELDHMEWLSKCMGDAGFFGVFQVRCTY